jgi:hypothetical protein
MSFRDAWELTDMVQRIQAFRFPPEIGRMITLNVETDTLCVTMVRTDRDDPRPNSVILHFVDSAPTEDIHTMICHGMEALYEDDELCEPKVGVIDTSYMGTDT